MFQCRKQGLEQCAAVVAGIMIKAGINTRILNLPKDGNLDDRSSAAPSIIYGEVKTKRKTNSPSRTLMFYNHYDVNQRILLNFGNMTPTRVLLKETIFTAEDHLMTKEN